MIKANHCGGVDGSPIPFSIIDIHNVSSYFMLGTTQDIWWKSRKLWNTGILHSRRWHIPWRRTNFCDVDLFVLSLPLWMLLWEAEDWIQASHLYQLASSPSALMSSEVLFKRLVKSSDLCTSSQVVPSINSEWFMSPRGVCVIVNLIQIAWTTRVCWGKQRWRIVHKFLIWCAVCFI